MTEIDDLEVMGYNYRQVDYMREWEIKIRAFSRKMIIKRLFNI